MSTGARGWARCPRPRRIAAVGACRAPGPCGSWVAAQLFCIGWRSLLERSRIHAGRQQRAAVAGWRQARNANGAAQGMAESATPIRAEAAAFQGTAAGHAKAQPIAHQRQSGGGVHGSATHWDSNASPRPRAGAKKRTRHGWSRCAPKPGAGRKRAGESRSRWRKPLDFSRSIRSPAAAGHVVD